VGSQFWRSDLKTKRCVCTVNKALVLEFTCRTSP